MPGDLPSGAIAPAWLELPAVAPPETATAVEPADDGPESLVAARAELDGATLSVHLLRAAPPDALPTALAIAGGLALASAAGLFALALWSTLQPSAPPFFALLVAGVAALVAAAVLRARDDLPRRLIVGPRGQLPAPDGALDRPLPVVRARGGAHELCFRAGMAGELTRDGQAIPLPELVARGAAWPCDLPGTFAAPLDGDAAARIELGPLTIHLRTVLAPRRLPARLRPEPAPVSALGGSFAGCLVVLAIALAIPAPPPGEGGAYAFQMHVSLGGPEAQTVSRVPIVCLGPGCVHPRLPKPTGRAGRREGHGSPGRGLFTLRGPKDNPDPHLARALAEDRLAASTPLQMLRELGAAASSGGSAIGSDAENVIGGLVGSQIGESYGAGGLGLVGDGAGDAGGSGGGLATIGYGSYNTVGESDGAGTGAGYGIGMGRLGTRRVAEVTCLIDGCALIRGSLDKAIIHRVVRRHLNEVRYCYEKALIGKPKLEGRATVRFDIAPSGIVSASSVPESTLGDAAVEQCLASAVRRWEFPRPRGGGEVIVNYPFAFHPAGE